MILLELPRLKYLVIIVILLVNIINQITRVFEIRRFFLIRRTIKKLLEY